MNQQDRYKAFVEEYYTDRKGTDSRKWDDLEDKFGETDLVPLWVADMDFKVPKAIEEALVQRIRHGVYGYTVPSKSYYTAYQTWEKNRYKVDIEPEWLLFSPGVVSSFYWAVQALTKPEDAVLILTPVYYPFHHAVQDQGRKLVTSSLVRSPETDRYDIDFADIEKKMKNEEIRLFIHCSPHNPVGRVWSREENEQLFALCAKYNCLIISDEIHQDLVPNPANFSSALTLPAYFDRLIVLHSLTKTFNLASLNHSHILIPNADLRKKMQTFVNTVQQTGPTLMGLVAFQAGYEQGEDWLNQLVAVVQENAETVRRRFAEFAPTVRISPLEGTYLQWIDLNSVVEADQLEEVVQKKARLAVDYGDWFGPEGKGFIRLNLATSPALIEQVLNQLEAALKD